MTEIQREMQNRISQEELDRAFDARFPKKMQEKLRNAKVAVAGLDGIGLIAPRVSACAAHEANQVLQLIMQNRKTEVAVCATREQ